MFLYDVHHNVNVQREQRDNNHDDITRTGTGATMRMVMMMTQTPAYSLTKNRIQHFDFTNPGMDFRNRSMLTLYVGNLCSPASPYSSLLVPTRKEAKQPQHEYTKRDDDDVYNAKMRMAMIMIMW